MKTYYTLIYCRCTCWVAMWLVALYTSAVAFSSSVDHVMSVWELKVILSTDSSHSYLFRSEGVIQMQWNMFDQKYFKIHCTLGHCLWDKWQLRWKLGWLHLILIMLFRNALYYITHAKICFNKYIILHFLDNIFIFLTYQVVSCHQTLWE